MCYDNSIIHIGALFQKGVCDLAEKRKDRNGRVLKTGENQRKTAPMNTVIPMGMAKYEVFTEKRWKRSARKRKPFNAIWQMVSTIRLVKSLFPNWLTDI